MINRLGAGLLTLAVEEPEHYYPPPGQSPSLPAASAIAARQLANLIVDTVAPLAFTGLSQSSPEATAAALGIIYMRILSAGEAIGRLPS